MEIYIVIGIVVILLTTGIYLNNKNDKPTNKPQKTDLQKFDMDKKIKICPICNTKNNINRKYCRHCNTWMKNITCPVCEHVNPFDQKYCEECDSILQNKSRY